MYFFFMHVDLFYCSYVCMYIVGPPPPPPSNELSRNFYTVGYLLPCNNPAAMLHKFQHKHKLLSSSRELLVIMSRANLTPEKSTIQVA